MDARITGNLGDILLREGLISEDQLKRARSEREKTGRPLPSILVGMGIISEKVKLSILQKKTGCSIASLKNMELEPLLAVRIPKPLAIRHGAVPVRMDADGLVIAMEDPSDLEALDQLSAAAGANVKPVLATSEEIAALLDKYPESEARPEFLPRGSHLGFIRGLTFWFFLLVPIGVLFALMQFGSAKFQAYLIKKMGEDIVNIAFYMLLGYGFWSLAVYYIHGEIFSRLMGEEQRPPRPPKED